MAKWNITPRTSTRKPTLADALQVPEVQALVEALRFYGDKANHAERFVTCCGDGCCTWPIGSIMSHDNEGDVARAALAAINAGEVK